jgi:hypothetical protein
MPTLCLSVAELARVRVNKDRPKSGDFGYSLQARLVGPIALNRTST